MDIVEYTLALDIRSVMLRAILTDDSDTEPTAQVRLEGMISDVGHPDDDHFAGLPVSAVLSTTGTAMTLHAADGKRIVGRMELHSRDESLELPAILEITLQGSPAWFDDIQRIVQLKLANPALNLQLHCGYSPIVPHNVRVRAARAHVYRWITRAALDLGSC